MINKFVALDNDGNITGAYIDDNSQEVNDWVAGAVRDGRSLVYGSFDNVVMGQKLSIQGHISLEMKTAIRIVCMAYDYTGEQRERMLNIASGIAAIGKDRMKLDGEQIYYMDEWWDFAFTTLSEIAYLSADGQKRLYILNTGAVRVLPACVLPGSLAYNAAIR